MKVKAIWEFEVDTEDLDEYAKKHDAIIKIEHMED